MGTFRYTAIDRSGQMTGGTMEAADAAAVIARLQREGNIPLQAEPDGGKSWHRFLTLDLEWDKALSRQDVAEFTRELSLMLAAGQDLDRTLRFLIETSTRPRVRAVLEQLRDAIRDGASLATALDRQPRSFPPTYTGLVRAGEAGGRLAATLEQMAELLERERSLAANVTSALIYPALLVAAAISSIALLLTRVLPQFVPLFEQNGAALPGPTQFLITAGAMVSAYGIPVALGLACLAPILRRASKVPALRLRLDRLLLRLPVIGSLAREVLAARFTRTLGTLLNNGVPLVGALAILRGAMGNFAAMAAVDEATAAVKGGGGLSRALAAAEVFPLRTIHLLQLGEEAALGPMALRAAVIHEEKARIGLQRLVSLLVPAITIVMGLAVAGIVSALLLAMLSLNDLAS